MSTLLDDVLPGRERLGSRRGPISRRCELQEVVDLAGHLEPRVHEPDQVVADPLQVGDEMR